MTDWNLPWKGGCRCGAVRIRVSAPPLLSAACHCTGCQKMTASAFSLTLSIPDEGFEIAQGSVVIGGMHGGDAHHHHCDYCKSWLFTRAPSLEGFVNLRSTMLDDARWARPFIEYFVDEKLPWVETGAVHSFPTFPDFAAYPALMAEYAQTGAWRA